MPGGSGFSLPSLSCAQETSGDLATLKILILGLGGARESAFLPGEAKAERFRTQIWEPDSWSWIRIPACCLLDLCPWARYFTSVCLGFLFCKMGLWR